MAKYSYQCLFHKEDDGWVAVFPDWAEMYGGMTDGYTWRHVLYMADDLLNLICLDCEEDGKEFPVPHTFEEEEGIYVRTIQADTEKYRKALEQYRRVKRFRMAERVRERYWYHKAPLSPDEEG